MPPQNPSQRHQSATTTGTTSSKKRKSMTSASMEAANPKRIKTETLSSPESKPSEPVDAVTEDTVYDAIISIKVGKAGTVFSIHRGLLRRASLFFRNELPPLAPTDDESLTLADENPEIFRRMKNWLYTATLTTATEPPLNFPWAALIATYTFASHHGIPALQNSCIDTAIRKRQDGGLLPGQADVNVLWRAPGNPFRLRHLLIDMFATGCDLRYAIAHNRFHPGFLQGLVRCLYEMKEERRVYERVDFWGRRGAYYVGDWENPVVVD